MTQSNTYKTKQRELILRCLQEHKDEHLTAEDITQFLKADGNTVGKTTVYRHLDRLVNESVVRRYIAEDGKSACFQFSDGEECHRHFHLKCTVCNRLFHLECDYLDEVSEHIFAEHKFSIDNTKTVFYGICEECNNDNT